MPKESPEPRTNPQESPQETPQEATLLSPKEELARLHALKNDIDKSIAKAKALGRKVSLKEVAAIKAQQQELREGLNNLRKIADQREQEAAKAAQEAAKAAKEKQLQEQLAKLRETGQEMGPETLGIPNLEQQYTANQELLTRHNLLEVLFTGELGIKAIDGKEYPMPSLEQIKERLEASKDLIEQKSKEDFKRMVIAPFGLPLKRLIQTYSETIIDHKAQDKLKGANGDDLELDKDTPLWVWDEYTKGKGADIEGSLVYYPKAFNENNHQGKTKLELLGQDPNQAFHIILLEQNPHIPRKGQGQTIGGRPQLEAGKSPKKYLAILNKAGTPYVHEQGLTPEDYLVYASLYLDKTNQVLDDVEAQIPDPKDPKKSIYVASIAYLTGAYLKTGDYLPDALWSRDSRRAGLVGSSPDNSHVGWGLRPAVRVP